MKKFDCASVPSARLLAALTMITGVASPAYSAEKAATKSLEEVIVVAQKRQQSLQDVPISVNAYSDQKLGEMNINSVSEIARIEPSLRFTTASFAFTANFSMRGVTSFSSQGGIQPSVALIIDGTPLSRAGEFATELGDIQRVEVLRGPQGTLYGKNATGGLINLVRKTPGDTFEASIEGSYTTDEEALTRFMVNAPLSDNVRARISAFYKDREGHIENVAPGIDNDSFEEVWGAMGKLQFDFSESVDLMLTAEYRDSYNGGQPQIPTIVSDPDRRAAIGEEALSDIFKINQDRQTQANIENAGFIADLSWQLNDSLLFKSITSYRDWFSDIDQDIDASPATAENTLNVPAIHIPRSNLNPNSDSEEPIVDKLHYVSQEFRFDVSTDSVDWTFGVFYQDYEEDQLAEVALYLKDSFFAQEAGVALPISTGEYFGYTTTPEAYMTLETKSAYTDITWHTLSNLDLFAGFRYTQEDGAIDHYRRDVVVPDVPTCFSTTAQKATFTPDAPGCAPVVNDTTEFSADSSIGEWSARAGASWFASDTTNVYATWARSFVGISFDPGRTTTQERAILDPSTSEAIEVGIKTELLGNRLRLNADVFHQETDNLQVSRLIPGTIETEAFNAGLIESYGLELDFAWQVSNNLRIDGAATWLNTEFGTLVQTCYVGQTEEDGCNIDNNGDGTPNAQDIAGTQAVDTPDVSYSISGRYEFPLESQDFDIFATASYSWQDDTFFQLSHDPLSTQEAYGLLDVSLGITERSDRYQIILFGKNVFDQEYVAQAGETDGVIGRVYVRTPRDAQRYWGIKARYSFF
ncbi:TonB-dependent receptor [Spongiibacter sp. KMU-166]|uniref:TonB-dependent receptor n=1 Tax=Spongiibacter thalassae TaxID=2721624 RepID=A0ABX1GDV3_9GAMM|nr:TonB-dependent receptor [Spongiibacter thalassae]NKI16434.1 TonB-dependent receptor [Spongiibacter thalassae]